MTKERPPWRVPFATVGGLWGLMFVIWLAGSPAEALPRRIGVGLACAAGFALLVAAILLLLGGANRGRVSRVRGRRAGWDVVAAWADESLAKNLAALGVDELLPRAPAALVMAWSRHVVELWNGGRSPSRLVRVEWDDVHSVDVAAASCGTLRMHGVAISLAGGARLVVCPSRRATGGVAGASAAEVQVLVEHLQGFVSSPRRRR